ncbi:hypothetical protein SAMN05661044_02134 [Olivibacter domesticus]|uniref:Uncharacterized protein n=1 Tax=Olivibacter domesticus TaxID=407022 RepID=A0A1H7MV17_OLID1|nr:hypothetical protein SAMN05661044_02134 [Olivibacter domesticus]
MIYVNITFLQSFGLLKPRSPARQVLRGNRYLYVFIFEHFSISGILLYSNG